MKLITKEEIEASQLLQPATAIQWVKESFSLKYSSKLPKKTSITYGEGHFMNTMPCMIPALNIFGAKIVTRFPGREPSIKADILLYRYDTGELLALMDGTAITALRTGAVAALAVHTFARPHFEDLGVMGLGETGRASLACLVELYQDVPLNVHLLRYKDHADRVLSWLCDQCPVWKVDILEDPRSLVQHSDVLLSCITYTDKNLACDEDFRPGCLVIPVHTRGFQNCDLFFDRVFADDRAHVEGFQYFDYFKDFAEIAAVLNGFCEGRKNEHERILSYNIGIATHDLVFAHHIYNAMLEGEKKLPYSSI